jgi:hypothetical protein
VTTSRTHVVADRVAALETEVRRLRVNTAEQFERLLAMILVLTGRIADAAPRREPEPGGSWMTVKQASWRCGYSGHKKAGAGGARKVEADWRACPRG